MYKKSDAVMGKVKKKEKEQAHKNVKGSVS